MSETLICPACGRDYEPNAASQPAAHPCVNCGHDLFESKHPKRCRCETCKREAAGMFAESLVEVQPEMF